MGFLFFHFKPKTSGGGEREGRRPAAFRAPEISPLTEVAAAATLRLAGNGLAFFPSFFSSSNSFFRFPSDLEIISLCFAIYRIFCLNSWEFKNGSQVVVFGKKDYSLYFSCQFEYLDLVQNLLVHGCDFRLPKAITSRVEWVFALFG